MVSPVIVLGAGIVGVSVAIHLAVRGRSVLLVDRQPPGEGASFGNAGLIQREAVFPYPFPRRLRDLLRIARNDAVDAVFHPSALPALAGPLLRYWWHSEPRRYAETVESWTALIATCLDEHVALAREADVTHLLRPIGWLRMHRDAGALGDALLLAERARREHGVAYEPVDEVGLFALEPSLDVPPGAGAIFWTDPYSVSDPHALTLAYAALFERLGGRVVRGEAATLARAGAGWRVRTGDGPAEAADVVVALGIASADVVGRFGYRPPLFGKRGYHRHYKLGGNAVLNHPVMDADHGFMLVPMRAGIRLATGAEFARDDAPKTPVQLVRAEPLARRLLPLREPVEAEPWMGVRPCMPDMLPAIGPVRGHPGLWCAFGHGHQGLTLGPTTGRLLAEMMTGERPFVDPFPYRPERF